jgi:VWFA-related protein
MVVEFDSSVNVLTEPTLDRDKIQRAIRKTGFGDGTSLYEAVGRTLTKYLAKIEGRKAVVLFTDGVDTTSWRAGYNDTLEDAEESEAVVFPIYYNTFLQNVGIGGGGPMSTPPTLGLPGSIGVKATQQIAEEYARGRTYLTELANVTGGKVFRAESTPGGLAAAFESIAEELRRQYILGYYPENPGSPGDRKAIRVRVNRPRLVIRARDSYIVGSQTAGR